MTIQTPTNERIREGWDAIAAGYDERMTAQNMALAERALSRTGIGAGTQVLDVAAGSGALAIPAARLGARVVAVDISPAMIERLSARAGAEGLSGVEGRVADGHALDFDDGTFDLAASQFGVMLFPDLARGLAEMARVTRPGGLVLVVAFSAPTKQEWLGFFLSAIRAVVPGFTGLPSDPPPLPFQVADPEVLAGRLRQAGLAGVAVETVTHELKFQSGTELFDAVRSSNPIGAGLVAGLTPGQRTEVQQVLDGMLRERSAGGPGGVVTSEVHIATGTR